MDNCFKAYLNHNICDPGCENPAKVFIFFAIYCFIHKIILNKVNNILWKVTLISLISTE